MSVDIRVGDALEVLRTLPSESVQLCVSSPPYWRQRDYGMAGQVGLEETPEEYIARLVAIFAEVRRVVAHDGTLHLNIGDKWASGGNGGGGSYKDKDLVGIPWMAAFALRSEGWFLRQCNIWAKPNGMPESVSDRSTVSHEYVFHLTKSNNYYYDAEAARTPAAPSTETRLAQAVEAQEGSTRANGNPRVDRPMKAVARRQKQRGHGRRHEGFNDRWDAMTKAEQQQQGANLRSVWWLSPANYREGHYAVMPNALAEICIASSSRIGDTVLDPFGGAGTTGLVASRLSRNALLIELNPEYAEMARRRIHDDAPLFASAPAHSRGGDAQ